MRETVLRQISALHHIHESIFYNIEGESRYLIQFRVVNIYNPERAKQVLLQFCEDKLGHLYKRVD